MLHTPEYQSMLKDMHASQTRWGSTAGRWAVAVLSYSGQLQAKTILDYGCGKQALKAAIGDRVDVKVTCYDPGIEGLDSEPEPADLVACIDVLEHVEPELIDNVLAHIRSKALKGVFLLISTRKAIAVLPDGRNAHLIVQPAAWWIEKVKQHFSVIDEAKPTDSDEVLIKARA